MERKTRFELATSSLARRRSTAELLPPIPLVPRGRFELPRAHRSLAPQASVSAIPPSRPLAGVEGLEPPTCGFGDRCSPKLSYTPAAILYFSTNLPKIDKCFYLIQNPRRKFVKRGKKRGTLTTPGATRTRDTRFRKPLLYPTELQGRKAKSEKVGDILATEFSTTSSGSTLSSSAIASACIPSIIWL